VHILDNNIDIKV